MTTHSFRNTLYTNDNLYVLSGLNSETVDLIYLDPPFNSKRMYSASVGSKAAGASFKDMWTWNDVDEHYLDTLADQFPAWQTENGRNHHRTAGRFSYLYRFHKHFLSETAKNPIFV